MIGPHYPEPWGYLPVTMIHSFPRKVIVYICIILIMSSDDQGDFQYYTLRSRKISKPRDLYLELFDRYEIWQVSRQLCCQSACPISKQHNNSNYLCRCFEAWWGFTLKQLSLQWRHNEGDGVSNQQPHECLLKRLFKRRSKKTSKLRVTGLCEGNSWVTGEFPAQRPSYAEKVSIWWRHHVSDIERVLGGHDWIPGVTGQ